MALLIKNGTVVTADGEFAADVLAGDDGRIQAIGKDLGAGAEGDEVFDAAGQYVMPGAIDPHTHIALPFMGSVSCDDWADGTVAALCGGTTTVFDFVIGTPGQGLIEALEPWMAKAEGKAACDYAYHMAVVDWNRQIAGEVAEVVRRGIPSFKTFTAYKGALMLNDEQLFRCMVEIQKAGGIMTIHAVNGDVLDAMAERFVAEGRTGTDVHHLCQPAEAEAEANFRAIQLAKLAGMPLYIVHTTCEAALRVQQRAVAYGNEVYCETCTQYLLLDDSLYRLPDFEGSKVVMSPPLRKKTDQEALWRGIQRGTVHTVGTDHAPFCFADQKPMGKDDFRKIPNGAPGIEERISLMYTYGVAAGKISMSKLVEVCCTRPAQLFGLGGRKGTISIGADADLVVYDPRWEGTFSVEGHHSKCDYSAYEGWARKGRPSRVWVRGRRVVEDGEFVGELGFGRHLERKPRS